MTTIDLNNLPAYSEQELVSWLRDCDDLYENDPDQLDVPDSTYDHVRRFCEISFPANQYFIGVGSSVRGGKIKLAYAMSGLLQKYQEDLQQWLNIVHETGSQLIASEKLDGTSAQIIYNEKGELIKAYSRGDGAEAADITRHILLVPSIPKQIPPTGSTTPVRAEMIISKSNWEILKGTIRKRDGSEYANARAAISSFMNSSTNPPEVYQYIHCVAYTIIDSPLSKTDQFDLLHSFGFKVPEYNSDLKGSEDYYTNLVIFFKQESEYELDGVVLDVNDPQSRKIVHSKGQAPSIKYKVRDASNIAVATVKQVVYTASKDGFIKPRVEIHPVDLCGVKISFATGFNAKFISDGGIGPGAKIKITRSGDVIPYITEVVYPVAPQLPSETQFGKWEWNDTGVDAVIIDSSSNTDVLVNKLTDTFTKLKIANLKSGNVQQLVEGGYDTLESILTMDYTDMYMLLGENGKKIYNSIEERLTNIYWPDFVGSLNMLGRGISINTITSLYNAFQGDTSKMYSIQEINSVPGFDTKTASLIVDNIAEVEKLIDDLVANGRLTIQQYVTPTAPSGSKFSGKNLVFTGFRAPDLEQAVMDEGGTIKSGISSAVNILVCADVNSASGKAKKARELGIEIIDRRELERRLL